MYELLYHRSNTMPDRLAYLRRPEVVRIDSAKPPSLACLCVDDEYGEFIVPGGAALISSGAIVIAVSCADSECQTQRKQKANGHTTEVQFAFFLFHNCSSLDFIAVIC